MSKPRIIAVQGLQFGSEAKGSIASMIAHAWKPETVAAAWQPNAGHTCWIGDQKFVHSMLPMAALAPSVAQILLGPGSVIDIKKLGDEIRAASRYLENKDIIIHPQAAVLCEQDKEREAELVSIGSTMKGSMRAYIRKMERRAFNQIDPATIDSETNELTDMVACLPYIKGLEVTVSSKKYDDVVDNSGNILLEGAQGFGLGIHGDFYPYCTSRDVSTAQLLADCRIPFEEVATIGVCRTFPIRVANRFDADGKQIGTSGPCYGDQREMQWSELNREPELTTVTKLPRRIFTFSVQQLRDACRIMRPWALALTFCDYLGEIHKREEYSFAPPKVWDLVLRIKHEVGMENVRYLSFGPRAEDIYQIGNDAGFLMERIGLVL